MRSKYFFWMTLIILCAAAFAFGAGPAMLNVPEGGSVFEEEEPGVTARVARISFIRGEAQIKRADSEDWEKATLNLPLVEGDTITTSPGSRIEIQFDTESHLRLDESAYLRLLKLRSEGIAVSISEGTASLRLLAFDKATEYFEVDAPSTTVAIQKAGLYRFDTGRQGEEQIRLTALDSGEARVYSENSGFTLKNGRSVRVFIAGERSGEWDTDRAAAIADAFDTWTLERDEVIARRLKEAHYDTYYDRDIYAADELNENGTWIHTRKYGYVWRPNRQATSVYANWSPYRYGTWRWIPYYGWSWVNDEPWGWATYHHGRWVYDSGHWYWSPYGYYRHSRSWWRPALVAFAFYGSSYCWYPLPYHYAYYNYNRYTVINNTTIINNYNVVPTPTPAAPAAIDPNTGSKPTRLPPIESVPATAVVAMDRSEFGRGSKVKQAPLAAAQAVLTQVPDDRQMAVKLPVVRDLNGQLSPAVKAVEPISVRRATPIKTGAAIRTSDAPLDNTLRESRMFGNRPPATKLLDPGPTRDGIRGTGAVDRLPDTSAPVKVAPTDRIRETPSAPIDRPRTRQEAPPVRQDTPRYEPPVRIQPPVRQPEAPRERPRDNPPVRQPEAPRERPRDNPPPVRQPDPPRERPRDNPPPPPVREEPKPESKPAPLDPPMGRKKDGR